MWLQMIFAFVLLLGLPVTAHALSIACLAGPQDYVFPIGIFGLLTIFLFALLAFFYLALMSRKAGGVFKLKENAKNAVLSGILIELNLLASLALAASLAVATRIPGFLEYHDGMTLFFWLSGIVYLGGIVVFASTVPKVVRVWKPFVVGSLLVPFSMVIWWLIERPYGLTVSPERSGLCSDPGMDSFIISFVVALILYSILALFLARVVSRQA